METKITKYLDSLNIPYRLLPHKKPVYTCEDAAKERNIPLDEMIKCILLADKDNNYFLTCCTADRKIDLRKVRGVLKCKRLNFASEKEIEEVTGYEMGAIPPLLVDIPVILDKGIEEKENVSISSGNPIAGIELKREDLINIAKPVVADIKQNEA